MGKLIIKFESNGKDAFDPMGEFQHAARAQYLMGKYDVYKMREIEIPGEDYTMSFDMVTVGDTIDWLALDYPSEEVRGKVREVMYYKDIASQLDKILEHVQGCRFEENYQMEGWALDAISIIENVKPPEYVNVNLHGGDTVGNIKYTINKEVNMLKYYKSKDSKKRKDEAMYDAKKHLNQDISAFSRRLKNYSPNK